MTPNFKGTLSKVNRLQLKTKTQLRKISTKKMIIHRNTPLQPTLRKKHKTRTLPLKRWTNQRLIRSKSRSTRRKGVKSNPFKRGNLATKSGTTTAFLTRFLNAPGLTTLISILSYWMRKTRKSRLSARKGGANRRPTR